MKFSTLTNHRLFLKSVVKHLAPWLSDKIYLHLMFYSRMGHRLHLSQPETYNEKIQWLKLYGRNERDAMLCDKYAVKEYVSKVIGAEYVIPLIGVWDNPEDIDFESLPDSFVLKCTHNSGRGMYICKDKSKMNREEVLDGLKNGIKEDFYRLSRDKCYKGIPHRIIAEEYREDSKTKELRDYKFFCFDGKPKLFFIAAGRSKGEHEVTFDFFDMDYNHLPFTNGHPNCSFPLEKPECFEEMKILAAKLSKGMPHVRIDFYEANGHVYFGEFTFSHWAGMMPFYPEEWDRKIGQWIKLPK